MRTFAARIAGLLLALALYEVVVRSVYRLSMVWEPGYGYIVEPGTAVTCGREGHGTSHWTAHGVRGATPRTERGAIVTLGDSITEAIQVDDDDVFTARLERDLRERSLPIPVINAGRAGGSAADYVAFAPRHLRLFSPRWMLIELTEADLANDAWEPGKPHFVETNGELSAEIVLPAPRGRYGSFSWDLRQRVMLVGLGFGRAQDFGRAFANEPPLFRAGAAAKVAPPPHVDAPIERELDLLFDAYEGRATILYLPAFDPKTMSEREPMEERVLSYCAKTKRSCVSIRDGFPDLWSRGLAPYGHANSSWNWGHMNVDGHRLAASRAADELVKLARDGLL